MAQGEPNEFYERMLNKINQTSYSDNTTFDEFSSNRPPGWFENSPNIIQPWKSREEDLNGVIDQLEQLKQIQRQQQINAISAQISPEIISRLDKIDQSIEILLNMLKLILTTQLEKEMRDSEKESYSELS